MTQSYIKRICEHCEKLFDAYVYNVKKGFGRFCSKACSNKSNGLGFKKGHKHFPWKGDHKEIGKKISKAKKGKKFSQEHVAKLAQARKKYFDRIGRKKCENKNGRRKCYKCVEWRKSIFSRDDYTCQMCGIRGTYLEADHVKGWAKFPRLRHVLSNGRTLCKPCHMTTPNYKNKHG